MPKSLVRYQESTNFHFVTFSCYGRRPWLADSKGYLAFEHQLEHVRQRYEFVVAGYVLMPEHVHLLVSEPRNARLSLAIQILKQQSSRELKKNEEEKFWQRRYYDFNVWNHTKAVEKIAYMHRNPVSRGLVEEAADCPWSSFRHYAMGLAGTVEIESQWHGVEKGIAARTSVSPTLRKKPRRMGHPQ